MTVTAEGNRVRGGCGVKLKIEKKPCRRYCGLTGNDMKG